jgi:hypothetical protein
MKGMIGSGILCLVSFVVSAGEDPACDRSLITEQPGTVKSWPNIPFDCAQSGLSRLHDNRAQLYQLMNDFNDLNRAVSADKTAQAYYEAARIFIGLAESFAVKAMARGDLTALERLNRTYRQYIEITELRIKGYDLIANRLERELR